MLPLGHSAILLTSIKRLSFLKHNFGLLFEWPLKIGFTALSKYEQVDLLHDEVCIMQLVEKQTV